MQDVLTAMVALKKLSGLDKIVLLGLGKGGPVALLSASLTSDFQKIFIDAAALRSGKTSLLLNYFVPGLGRIGDFTTAAAFISPQPLTLFDCTDQTKINVNRVNQIYKLYHRERKFRVLKKKLTPKQIQMEF